jgi:hypothetical protein
VLARVLAARGRQPARYRRAVEHERRAARVRPAPSLRARLRHARASGARGRRTRPVDARVRPQPARRAHDRRPRELRRDRSRARRRSNHLPRSPATALAPNRPRQPTGDVAPAVEAIQSKRDAIARSEAKPSVGAGGGATPRRAPLCI